MISLFSTLCPKTQRLSSIPQMNSRFRVLQDKFKEVLLLMK
jgi:hypothetical protein